MNKRIFILYTGGTIGMQRSPQGYVPMPGLAQLIAQKIPVHLSANMPAYDLYELDRLIDSTNMTPHEWRQIAQRITEQYTNYDGFVILHGTDTMAYTASALSFMLQGVSKPVIVTGSQIPLSELRNDAQDNLITALLLASNYPIAEVCLYFNGRLLRGNRATKVKASGFDAFDSPNYPWLGQVGIHIEIDESHLLQPSGQEHFLLPEFGAHQIVPLRLFPGMPLELLQRVLEMPLSALLLQSYGVGNAPDGAPGFLRLLEEAVQRGTLVLNLSQCLYGSVDQSSYATGSALARAGVLSGADMTLEAAYSKLHYLFASGLDLQQVSQRVQSNLCGEMTV